MKISVLQLDARSLASAPTESHIMNISRRTNRPVWLAALALLMGGGFIHAQSLTALAGHWNGVNFNVPAELLLFKNEQGQVVNIPTRIVFQVWTNRFDITSNGAVSGTRGSQSYIGTASIGGQGEVNFARVGDLVTPLRVNQSQDFLASAFNPGAVSALMLLLRSPATLTVADLAGQWDLQQFQTPAELVQIRPQPLEPVTDVLGGDSFETFSGSLTISANGDMTGNAGGEPVSGTLAVTGTGEVALAVDTGEGILQITLFVNAGKDLLVGVNQLFGQDDNFQELIVLSKAPANTTPADLAGPWKVNYFATPASLTLVRDLQGAVTDILEKNQFEVGRQSLTAGHDGFFTALIDDPALGRFTVASPGSISVTLTNSQSEVSSVTFKLNAAKDTLVGIHGDGEGQEALVLTKAPAVAGGRQDFGLLLFGNGVFWAAGVNRKLQASGQLPGDFEDVPGTTGLHAFPLPQNPTGSQFFQVIE